MQTKTNFTLYLLMLALLSLPSCESRGDVKKLTFTLNGIVKQQVPVKMDIGKYINDTKKQDPSRMIKGNYILSSGSFNVDVNDILKKQNRFSDVEVNRLKLVEDITLRNKGKSVFDLSRFNAMKIFVGDEQDFLAETTSDNPDELVFKVKDKDLLNYVTEAGELEYFIATDSKIELNEVDVVKLLMDLTMDVELVGSFE